MCYSAVGCQTCMSVLVSVTCLSVDVDFAAAVCVYVHAMQLAV